ncbi:MAG: ribonuclease PH [Verrucomicrobiales bacterium]|nr:ribonuclease PH [Verrucomicrobiales bacterium]MBV62951.1 ribonuclease PH [Rickettsiales bacterium]
MDRPDSRTIDELRTVSFLPNIAANSTGSVLVSFGKTRVICSAIIQPGVPRWMKEQGVEGGWLTAEYSMLPYSTGGGRKPRDVMKGKLDGRSSEIQRLIGRSLRAVVDLKLLGANTLWVDCDVLEADGGTRTASITGSSVACAIAFDNLIAKGTLKSSPLKQHVSAVSCGIYKNTPILDLCYIEDRDATVDFNIVMTESMDFVELQGSGEEASFTNEEMESMLSLGKKGITEIAELQKQTVISAKEEMEKDAAKKLADHFN